MAAFGGGNLYGGFVWRFLVAVFGEEICMGGFWWAVFGPQGRP